MKVLGICAGNGVMIHPFKKYLIGNIETRSDFKTPGNEQWKANFGDIPLLHDYNGNLGHVDIIIGHPDCGHSSALAYSRGKKLSDSTKNYTIQLYFKAIEEYKPKIFFFENLPALFKTYNIDDFRALVPDYELVMLNESVSAFGNSQISRIRLLVIGIRKDLPNKTASIFKLPSKEKLHLKLVSELESNLNYPSASLCHIRENEDDIVCMEKDFRKLSLKEIRDEWNSPKYENRKKWDATTTGKGNMLNLPGVYRNLPNSFPLTARKQNRQFNSKGEIMSPRELARIQNIPDDFRLWFDLDKTKYCLNKARVTATKTPPYDLGLWFYKRIIKLKKKWPSLLTKQKD